MKNINKHSWYSIIIILLIIWFLLILTVGVFSLVLKELKWNNAMWDYIKAYAWAESGGELALLKIKKEWYAYYDKINHDINDRSLVLSRNPLDGGYFNRNKDVLLSYDIWSKVWEYNWELEPLSYDIIPLFYLDDTWEHKVLDIDFSVVFWNDSDLNWNIISKNSWISGTWVTTNWFKKTLTNNGFSYDREEIDSFLVNNESNYLVLLNTGNFQAINYNIKSVNDSEFFTSPKTTIFSSAEVWNYKQNLKIDLNNTEFLNMLKYSIYSN